MIEASIPVDLFNPGQVLASMGFLEAADALCGGAVGGFDWSQMTNVGFVLRANIDRNPFASVLDFLSNAEITRVAPPGYRDPVKKKNKGGSEEDEETDVESSELVCSESFPAQEPDPLRLPIRLTHAGQTLQVSHWADESSRYDFKLYAGPRSAAKIATAMLKGTRAKPHKGRTTGSAKNKGIEALWRQDPSSLTDHPFHLLSSMGGSFNLDPRGAWTALDAGYSPNDQKHAVAASPVLEMLAAIGLEHARPATDERRKSGYVAYAAWGDLLTPLLARAALSGALFGVPLRQFRFKFAFSGKNTVINFAEEI